MSKNFVWNVYDRQQTVRQLHLCPNCLSEHPKGQCNSKNRCQIDNCTGFHQSTIQRNNFNTTQHSTQAQKQLISEYRHNGDGLNGNQFNFTNNSSPWNKNLSTTNPNYNHQARQNGNSSYNRLEADTTAARTTTTKTTTTTTTALTATATKTQIVTTTIVTATTDKTGTSIPGSHIKCPIHPICSNSNQLRETLTNNISTQQTKIRNFSQAAIVDTRTTFAEITSRAFGSAHMFSSKQYR